MRPQPEAGTVIDHFGTLNTHRHGIRKVSEGFGNKSAEKQKKGVFTKTGGANRNFKIWALPEHFGSWVAS